MSGDEFSRLAVRAALEDEDRLDALRRSTLMELRSDPTLDRATRLAARLLDVPVALVSFLDARRQHIVASNGVVDTPVDVSLSASLCQFVVVLGEPLAFADVDEMPEQVDVEALGAIGIGSYLGAPLRDGDGEVLGAICVGDRRPRSWSDDDVTTIEQLAALCESHLRLDGLLEETRRREEGASRLAEFGARLASATTVDDVIAATRDVGARLVGSQTATLVEVAGMHLQIVATLDVEESSVEGFRQMDRNDRNPFADAIRENRIVVFESQAELVGAYPDLAAVVEGTDRHAYAVVPFSASGSVHGALGLMWDRPRRFAAWERELLAELGLLGGGGYARVRTGEDARALAELEASLSEAASALDVAEVFAHGAGRMLDAEVACHVVEDGVLRSLATWPRTVDADSARPPAPFDRESPIGRCVADRCMVVACAHEEHRLLADAVGADIERVGHVAVSAEVARRVCVPVHARSIDLVLEFVIAAGRPLDARHVWIARRLGAMAERSFERAVLLDRARGAQLRLRGVLDGLFVNVAILDADGRLVDANAPSEQLTGRSKEGLLGTPLWDLPIFQSTPDLSDELRTHVLAVRDEATYRRFDVVANVPGNPPAPFDVQLVPIVDDGVVSAIVLSAIDISDRLRFEDQQRQLLDRQRLVTERLQRSLLPTALPELPGWEIAARYRASDDDVDVGGDWYDAFVGGDGALSIVIGDVVGSGVDVAGATGQMRSATRALVDVSTGPADLVSRVEAFSEHVPAVFASTMLYLQIDPTTGICRFSRAGHIPPLFVRGDGSTEMIVSDGSGPIGVGDGVRSEGTFVVAVGDVLVLCTDGLIERPGESLDAGFRRLADAVAGRLGDRSLDAVVAAVLDDLIAGERTRDDICLVAVRRVR